MVSLSTLIAVIVLLAVVSAIFIIHGYVAEKLGPAIQRDAKWFLDNRITDHSTQYMKLRGCF